MPVYDYLVADLKGKHLEGQIEAVDRGEAIVQLKEKEWVVISLDLHRPKKKSFLNWQRVSFKERLILAKQLSSMLRAGLNLYEALDILMKQSQNAVLNDILKDITKMMREGQSFGQSLAKYPKVFSPIFVHMVEAGEKSGALEDALKYLAKQLDQDYALRRKIKGAMIYPVVILILVLVVSVGLITFIVPKISKIFRSFQLELPLPTRILIWLSEVFSSYGIFIFLGTVVFIVGFIMMLRLPSVRPYYHRFLLRMPLFGRLIVKVNLARFSRLLSSLLKSGIPISKALSIVGNTLGNVIYQREVALAQEKVMRGSGLSETMLLNEKLFPPLMPKMIYVGEKSGRLEETTRNLALLYETEVKESIKSLSTLIEPLLLVIVAASVGGIALSMITPIYQLPSLISR